MNAKEQRNTQDLKRRLSEAQAIIDALLSGEIDAVVDAKSNTPVLLSKAQDALRESEERYRQIVEATTDGIIKIDNAALIVFVNRRFAEMLGYEPDEIIGTSVYELMNPVAKKIAIHTLQTRGRLVAPVDTTFSHKDGTQISVDMAGSPLVDGEGRHVGNLAVVRDVTERKRLQSQLMVSDRMASVGTLAAGVAHEINNPLAAVMANLDFLSDSLGIAIGSDSVLTSLGKTDAWFHSEIKEPLDDARDAAQRVRFIVRDLKIFSRSPSEESRGLVDVKSIMESSVRMAWNEIRHRARLVKEYGPVPSIQANEARLGQVFLNLIVNAAQSLTEGRAEHNEIRVVTRLEGERAIIEVRDTGPGIPPELICRIFDAFFTTKAVGVGTGLGLAICQRIVTDMAGELTVESEVGKGTTFRVTLPVGGRTQLEPVVTERASAVAGRRGRVMVIDDEPLVIRSMTRLLSKEHEVVGLLAAKAALALCAAGEKFDLILCDLMMPDMTGMDLHRELSLIAPAQADRMIFVTGGAFTPETRQFLSVNEYLEKPFEPASLRAFVRRYLE